MNQSRSAILDNDGRSIEYGQVYFQTSKERMLRSHPQTRIKNLKLQIQYVRTSTDISFEVESRKNKWQSILNHQHLSCVSELSKRTHQVPSSNRLSMTKSYTSIPRCAVDQKKNSQRYENLHRLFKSMALKNQRDAKKTNANSLSIQVNLVFYFSLQKQKKRNLQRRTSSSSTL